MSERTIRISASILSADFTRLGDEIRSAEDAGVDMIHIDVMDGHFVPNLTMGPFVVEAVRRATDLPIDAHLMIDDPATYAPQFADAGADYVVFHREACEDPGSIISVIRERGARPGLAVNPPNPADGVRPFLAEIDLVLVMTVNPGFAGQSFIDDVMPKLGTIRDWKREDGLGYAIAVDGGVNPETAPSVVRHGGEILVAASAIFRTDNRALAVASLRQAALGALEEGGSSGSPGGEP